MILRKGLRRFELLHGLFELSRFVVVPLRRRFQFGFDSRAIDLQSGRSAFEFRFTFSKFVTFAFESVGTSRHLRESRFETASSLSQVFQLSAQSVDVVLVCDGARFGVSFCVCEFRREIFLGLFERRSCFFQFALQSFSVRAKRITFGRSSNEFGRHVVDASIGFSRRAFEVSNVGSFLDSNAIDELPFGVDVVFQTPFQQFDRWQGTFVQFFLVIEFFVSSQFVIQSFLRSFVELFKDGSRESRQFVFFFVFLTDDDVVVIVKGRHDRR